MVFDAAADAAVGEIDPFFDFLAILGDGQGFLDVGCVAEFCMVVSMQ